MAITPNDLLLFARVVDEGSFTAAAERLDLPKSTVSRRVAALEAGLGERLLLRTTRKLTVTDFGRSILAHAHQVADEVAAASQLAQHRQIEPSGRLRVSMPADFANAILAELLAGFVARYPAITLEIDLSPRRVDLIGENFDVAIRMGALPDDASLAARQLAAFSTGLYASPAYLKRRGVPASPAALMEHDALLLLTRSGDALPWTLTSGMQLWDGLPPARATANSPELLTRLARLGSGIAVINNHFAVPYITNGELVPVLPDWSPPVEVAWAVFPGRRLMPARARVFIDALAEEFSGPRCQAAEARLKKSKAQSPATSTAA
jgi:DNA-binding transcriptional LysR family regulator